MSPRASIADLISWGPCWDAARIREVAGRRRTFTALDVLAREDIDATDRLWVVLRPELIDDRTLRLWACWCVRHTPLPDGRKVWDLLTDERSRNAVEVAEACARGEVTAEQLDAARDAQIDELKRILREKAGLLAHAAKGGQDGEPE